MTRADLDSNLVSMVARVIMTAVSLSHGRARRAAERIRKWHLEFEMSISVPLRTFLELGARSFRARAAHCHVDCDDGLGRQSHQATNNKHNESPITSNLSAIAVWVGSRCGISGTAPTSQSCDVSTPRRRRAIQFGHVHDNTNESAKRTRLGHWDGDMFDRTSTSIHGSSE